MTRILFFFIIVTTFSCQTPSSDKEVIQTPSVTSGDTIINLPNNDSIKRQEIFKINDSIKIHRHWENQNNINDQIDISIDTSPEISLYHNTGNSSTIFKIIGITNFADSISLNTTNYKGDTAFIWTLKNIKSNKGIWTNFKPQTKSYRIIGSYLSKPNDVN